MRFRIVRVNLHLVIALILAIGSACLLNASPKLDFEREARRSFALWQCSFLVTLGEIKNSNPERFFEQGKSSFEKLLLDPSFGRFVTEDSESVPLGVLVHMRAKYSIEFQLGYLWAFTKDWVRSGLAKNADDDLDLAKKRTRAAAMQKYIVSNCELLLEPSQ